MNDRPPNPVDAILTLLGIKPTDNRWNLPEVRQWRDYCNELVTAPRYAGAATFTDDEVETGLAAIAPPFLKPAEEKQESEADRVARLSALQQRAGKLL